MWCNTVLLNALEKTTKGENLKITYLGLKKSKTGREYKNYQVIEE